MALRLPLSVWLLAVLIAGAPLVAEAQTARDD
jgi:hypothetical protein